MTVPIDIINVILSYRKPTHFDKKGYKFKQGNTDFELVFTTAKEEQFNIGEVFTILFINDTKNEAYELTEEYYTFSDGVVTIPAITNFVKEAGNYSFIIESDLQYSYKASYKVSSGDTELILENLPEYSGQYISKIEEIDGLYTAYDQDGNATTSWGGGTPQDETDPVFNAWLTTYINEQLVQDNRLAELEIATSKIFNYKGTIASIEELYAITDAENGDVYLVPTTTENLYELFVYEYQSNEPETNWNLIGQPSMDLSNFWTKDQALSIDQSENYYLSSVDVKSSLWGTTSSKTFNENMYSLSSTVASFSSINRKNSSWRVFNIIFNGTGYINNASNNMHNSFIKFAKDNHNIDFVRKTSDLLEIILYPSNTSTATATVRYFNTDSGKTYYLYWTLNSKTQSNFGDVLPLEDGISKYIKTINEILPDANGNFNLTSDGVKFNKEGVSATQTQVNDKILNEMVTSESLSFKNLNDNDIDYERAQEIPQLTYLENAKIKSFDLTEKGVDSSSDELIYKKKSQTINTQNTEIIFDALGTTKGTKFAKEGNGIKILDASDVFELGTTLSVTLNNVWLSDNLWPVSVKVEVVKNGIATGLAVTEVFESQAQKPIKVQEVDSTALISVADNDVLTLQISATMANGEPLYDWAYYTVGAGGNFQAYYRNIIENGIFIPANASFSRRLVINKTNTTTIPTGTHADLGALVTFDVATVTRNTNDLYFNPTINQFEFNLSQPSAFNFFSTFPIQRTGGGAGSGAIDFTMIVEWLNPEVGDWVQYYGYANSRSRLLPAGNAAVFTTVDYTGFIYFENRGSYRVRIFWVDTDAGNLNHAISVYDVSDSLGRTYKKDFVTKVEWVESSII